MPPSDRQILAATHRGDEASARLLWDRYGPRLTAHARAIVRDGGAADDVVQTVLCRLLDMPGRRIRAIEDVPAFLAMAVRREALNHLRGRRRARGRESGMRPGMGSEASDRVVEVRDAIECLPRRLREVVVLRHVGELSFDQMATALATNRNTVASRYRSAIGALRRLMGAECEAAEGVAHAG